MDIWYLWKYISDFRWKIQWSLIDVLLVKTSYNDFWTGLNPDGIGGGRMSSRTTCQSLFVLEAAFTWNRGINIKLGNVTGIVPCSERRVCWKLFISRFREHLSSIFSIRKVNTFSHSSRLTRNVGDTTDPVKRGEVLPTRGAKLCRISTGTYTVVVLDVGPKKVFNF